MVHALAASEVAAEISKASTLPVYAAAALQTAAFDIEPLSISFELQDGVVQLEKIRLSDAAGQVEVTSYLELASMKLVSEWRLAAGLRDETSENLQLTLVFAGPVSQFGRMKPVIQTKALNRYITVQRIAREVEHRRLLTERKRKEAEAAAQAALKGQSAQPAAAPLTPDGQGDRQVPPVPSRPPASLTAQGNNAATAAAVPAASDPSLPWRSSPSVEPSQPPIAASPQRGSANGSVSEDSAADEPAAPQQRTSRRPRSRRFLDEDFSNFSN